jgi:hypothetical protein
MTNFAKNIVSVIALMLFMTGSILTIVGVFRTHDLSEHHIDEEFIIPSQILNSLTVMFLLYLISTSTFSPMYKLLIIILLVGGLIIEIYLTSYADRQPESIAAYVFIAINLLLRAFFLIDLVQGEWVKPFTQSVKPVQRIVTENVVKPVEQVVKDVLPTYPLTPKLEPTDQNASRELQSKWDKLRKLVEGRSEGLNRDSESEAFRSVIRPAKNSGRTDIKEVLREAVALLKDKDGVPIPLNTVEAVGGRKRS